MKRLLVLLVCLAATSFARADQPYLEFIRNLRKTYPDLAQEYLEKLSKEAPPPAIAKLIPLEMARTRLERAAAEADPDKRMELYQQARLELEDFRDKNKNDPLAATVEGDIARLLVLQGRAQLAHALAEESLNAQQTEADKARKLLADGAARLAKVRETLSKQIDKLEPKTDEEKKQKRELEESRQQCQFEEALAWLDQIRTYVKPTVAADQAKIDAAKKSTKLMNDAANTFEPKNSLGWEATAWLIVCYFNEGERGEAHNKYVAVLKDPSPASATGKRLARYFILDVWASENLPVGILPAGQKPADVIRADALGWIAAYPAFLKTPEGYGVQYKLAENLLKQAETQTGATRAATFARIKEYCRTIEQGESEWTSKARRLKLGIMFEEKAFDKPVAALIADNKTTFDDCFVRAQFEMSRLEKDPQEIEAEVEKKKAKVEAEITKLEDEAAKLPDGDQKKKKEDEIRKKRAELDVPELKKKKHDERFQNAITALTQALKLADKPPLGQKKPPEKDEWTAKASLAYAHMTRGHKDDLARAMDLGEELARIKTRPAASAQGAMIAMQAMAEVLTQGERSGFLADEQKAVRKRFEALADFMKKSWPNDTPGDMARHQLALMYIRDMNYPLAVKELASLRPGYTGAIHAQFQLAMAALGADKAGAERAEGDPDDRPFKERAQAALETLPELPETADEGTNYTWLLAKSTLAKIYYVNKEFDKLEALATPLKDRAAKKTPMGAYVLKLPPDPMKDLNQEMASGFATLSLYAKYGRADAAFKAMPPRLGDVLQILSPVINDAVQGKAEELEKEPALRWALFSLALRAAIQDNQLDKANTVIVAIQKTSGGGGEDGGNSEVQALLQLSTLINQQMIELKKKNQPELMAKAKGSFSKLLDGMMDATKKSGKPLTLEQSYALAKSYASLGSHKQAAELLKAIPPPKNEKDERAMGIHIQIQVEVAKQLRLAKELDEAEKVLTPLAGKPTKPEGPASKGIEARKELIYLHYQDKELYGAAFQEWDRLTKGIVPLINQPGMKDHYFECYFNTVYCMTKSAPKQADNTKKDQLFKQAANLIVALEKQYPDRGGEEWKLKYDDLLDTTPELKKEYEAQKPK